ncbi:PDC sensor domain-containing protein [Aneurinibacillus tyrosinisolvens]|uniref:PDC sensor domain-containing protein n=1 Tax=Aneurinibacillus tyrosinisolvens TaxID=1443435 RepID=UPI00063F86B4|nr:cache domain-containing protein [Aneurinibacillus tyrosinisolvens]
MRTLRGKLLLLIIPIFILSLSAVAYINHNKAKGFLRENFENEAVIKLNSTQEKVDDWIQHKKDIVKMLAVTDEVTGRNTSKQLEFFHKILKDQPDLEMLYVSNDTTGKQAITTEGKTIDISNRPYFQEALKGNVVVTDPLISRATNQMVIVTAAPLYSGGKVTGMVGATVLVEKLIGVVNEQKIGQTGYAYMFNKDGLVIAHPKKENILKLNLHSVGSKELSESVAKAIQGQNGLIEYKFEGVDKYAFYKKIKNADWGITITAPISEATEKMVYLAKLSFATAAVVLFFTVVTLIVFATRLVRPIRRLSNLTQQIATGDLTMKSEVIQRMKWAS